MGSGKLAFVQSLGYGEADCSDSADSSAPVLVDAQLSVNGPGFDGDVAAVAEKIAASKRVVVLVEVGNGIVPLDPEERAWRDRVGLLSRELAARSDAVVRMVCGIPTYLKGEPQDCMPSAADAPRTADEAGCGQTADDASTQSGGRNDRSGLEIVIMRHGTSTYNEERRYAGWTDVPLSLKGIREAQAAGVCPQVKKVYVSPLMRARQTAQICFPHAEQVVVDGLQEMNFGDFEGRTANEMENDAAYRTWVDGMCADRCPNGEGPQDMIVRMERAVGEVVRMAQAAGEERAIIVAHGGTIMAALTGVTGDGNDYFGWQVGNCEGYRATVVDDGEHLRYEDREHFRNLDFLREAAPACEESDQVNAGSGAERTALADAHAQGCSPAADGAAASAPAASCEQAADTSDRPSWQEPESFFQNRACKYFPCHEGVSADEFNCLFCYCPLYALGPNCGGNFTYTANGRKNCTNCIAPHLRDNGAKIVMKRYEMLAELASRK